MDFHQETPNNCLRSEAGAAADNFINPEEQDKEKRNPETFCFLCLSQIQHSQWIQEDIPFSGFQEQKKNCQVIFNYLLHSCDNNGNGDDNRLKQSFSRRHRHLIKKLVTSTSTSNSSSSVMCLECETKVEFIVTLQNQLETLQLELISKLANLKNLILTVSEDSTRKSKVRKEILSCGNPSSESDSKSSSANEWMNAVIEFQSCVSERKESFAFATSWLHNEKCRGQDQGHIRINKDDNESDQDDYNNPVVKIEPEPEPDVPFDLQDFLEDNMPSIDEGEEQNDDKGQDPQKKKPDLPQFPMSPTPPPPSSSPQLPSPPSPPTRTNRRSKRLKRTRPRLSRSRSRSSSPETPKKVKRRKIKGRKEKKSNTPSVVPTLTLKRMRKNSELRSYAKNYRCDLCPDFNGTSVYALIQHLRGHDAAEHKTLHCYEPDCDESFSNQQLFAYHSAQHHDFLMRWRCKICRFHVHPSRLVTHMRTDHPDFESFPCPYCYQCSPSIVKFAVHVQLHSKIVYNCLFCEKIFSPGNLIPWAEHLRDVHGRQDVFQLSCEFCPEKFLFKEHRDAHVSRVHDARHCCHICSKTYSSVHSLKSHLQLVHLKEKIVPCDYHKDDNDQDAKCSEKFENKDEMVRHKILAHGFPPLKCPDCPAMEFMTPVNLRRHRTRNHGGREFQCRTCSKVFQALAPLKRHELIHGEKTLICDTCGFAATSKKRLSAHAVIHREVARLPCPHCPKRFNYRRALEDHIRTHTGEKPYQCHYCSRPFGVKQSLTNHVKKVHEKN